MTAYPFETLEYGAIQVQVQIGSVTAENMRDHLDRQTKTIDEAIAAGPPYQKGIIIVDASVDLVPPATIRKMQADWTNQNEHKLEQILHGMGFVVPSALTRGAMTAVMWLIRPKWPMIAHASLEEAIAWALTEADAVGADVDSRLRRYGAGAVQDDRTLLLTG